MSTNRGSILCAERREGRLVLSVQVATSARSTTVAVATGSSVREVAASTAATALASATATTVAAAIAASTTSAATPTTSTAVTRVDRSVVSGVHSDQVLRLVLLLAGLLAAGACEVGFLSIASMRGSFGELLLGALIGLAELQVTTAESQTLRSDLGQVLVVRLGLVLLRCNVLSAGGAIRTVRESGIGARGIRREAALVSSLGFGNLSASSFVLGLGGSVGAAPAMCGLLVVLAMWCQSMSHQNT